MNTSSTFLVSAAAALLFARGLLDRTEAPVSDGASEQPVSDELDRLGGRPVVVSWSAGADQALAGGGVDGAAGAVEGVELLRGHRAGQSEGGGAFPTMA